MNYGSDFASAIDLFPLICTVEEIDVLSRPPNIDVFVSFPTLVDMSRESAVVLASCC